MKQKKLVWMVLLAGVLMLSLSACGVRLKFNRTADMAKQMAAEITEFDLPKGYKAAFSGTYNEYTLVAYTHTRNDSGHIYLLQSENPADLDIFREGLEELMPEQMQSDTDFTVLETSEATVRGAEGLIVTAEGVNSDQITYRQVMAFFEGKGGPAVLVYSELLSEWDEAQAEALIESIR